MEYFTGIIFSMSLNRDTLARSTPGGPQQEIGQEKLTPRTKAAAIAAALVKKGSAIY